MFDVAFHVETRIEELKALCAEKPGHPCLAIWSGKLKELETIKEQLEATDITHTASRTEEWHARAVKEALAYWLQKERGTTSSATAEAVKRLEPPIWAEDLADFVFDFEERTGVRIHDGKLYREVRGG